MYIQCGCIYLKVLLVYSDMLQIYMTTTVVRSFGAICFLFVISQLPKLTYNSTVGKQNTVKIMPSTFPNTYHYHLSVPQLFNTN